MTGDEEAPEELLEAARIRRDFLAHMRHELRTPLNAIIGYGEMLLEDAADQGRRAFIPDLEKIRVSGQQLLALVNDILAPLEGWTSRYRAKMWRSIPLANTCANRC